MIEKLKLPRFRFSLLTLLVTFAAISLWLGIGVRQVRQREEIARYLISQKAVVTYGPPGKPWNYFPLTWQILRARTVADISIASGSSGHTPGKEDIERIQAWFPEARIGYH